MGKLKIATLFSGIGTPENALKALAVEHQTIFACEIDKYARVTYLANNDEPNTFYEDVYNIDGKKYLNQIDILIGGSPCQSFSIAGKRLGTSCPRGNLIYEYFRIVEEAKPKVFIYENVKGFLSIDKGETFENFKNSFKEIGYTVYHQVLNTKDYGIPQNRERIYIVGFKDNVDFHFWEKQELKLRLKDMLEDEVDKKYLLSNKLVSYFEKHKEEQDKKGNGFGWSPLSEKNDISFTITNPGKNRPNETYIKLNQTHQLNIKGNDSIKRIYSSDGLCPSLTTMQGGHREPKVAIEKEIIKLFDIPKEILNDNERQRRVYSPEGISPAVIARSDSAKILQNTNSKVAIANGVNEKELEYEKSTFNQKDTIEILRILWGEAREEAFKKWGLGINDSFYQEEILQQRLHGKEFCENRTKQSGLFISPFICETDKQTFYRERFLPTMWKAWKSRCTSYRRGLSEQQSIQFNDFMQKLSHERTYHEADMQYRKLQYESQRIWVLRKALSKIQKMGRSNENKKTEKHNYIFRKLTERECFRLQGFDDSFIFPPKISSTQLYKQAGNGMSRNILEMLFTQILIAYTKHIEEKQNENI